MCSEVFTQDFDKILIMWFYINVYFGKMYFNFNYVMKMIEEKFCFTLSK